ncbi:hypothetical protein AGLY_004394, partial [Aphis glycines]
MSHFNLKYVASYSQRYSTFYFQLKPSTVLGVSKPFMQVVNKLLITLGENKEFDPKLLKKRDRNIIGITFTYVSSNFGGRLALKRLLKQNSNLLTIHLFFIVQSVYRTIKRMMANVSLFTKNVSEQRSIVSLESNFQWLVKKVINHYHFSTTKLFSNFRDFDVFCKNLNYKRLILTIRTTHKEPCIKFMFFGHPKFFIDTSKKHFKYFENFTLEIEALFQQVLLYTDTHII